MGHWVVRRAGRQLIGAPSPAARLWEGGREEDNNSLCPIAGGLFMWGPHSRIVLFLLLTLLAPSTSALYTRLATLMTSHLARTWIGLPRSVPF